jgi:arylsulfatase A-like enzyme
MAGAIRWLEENRDREPFFLHVDTFDPHEPWDAPTEYTELYETGYEGDEVIYPRYDTADHFTEAEIAHMHHLYAGECTMVDRWIGKLLAKIDALGLRDSTVVIITADHGFCFGERGHVGKLLIRHEPARRVTALPLHDEIAAIPLMVRVPGAKPGRSDAFAQPPDIAATVLDVFGVEPPEDFDGRSLVPAARGEGAIGREAAVTSSSAVAGPDERWSATVTTRRWRLVMVGRGAVGDDEPARLHDREADPLDRTNVIADRRNEARELADAYLDRLAASGAKAETVAAFREYFSAI